MPNEFLDRCEIKSRHYKVTGESMPEVVEAEILDSWAAQSAEDSLASWIKTRGEGQPQQNPC